MAIGRTNAQSTDSIVFTYDGSFTTTGKRKDKNSKVYLNGDWEIFFLTSGTLTVYKCSKRIDKFLVGGGGKGGMARVWYFYGDNYCGGGGAGGGFTKYSLDDEKLSATTYPIEIGGGSGNTTAFGITAPCGLNGNDANTVGTAAGSNGGSGGGAARVDYQHANGGTDGNNGLGLSGVSGGTGQRNIDGYGYGTHAYNESDNTLYSTGGEGGYTSAAAGGVNTGDGGQGGDSRYNYSSGAEGGSGIVRIRNARGS